MKHSLRFRMHKMILLASFLSLSYLSGCRNKIGAFEICVTLDQPGFYCANQAVPSQENGFEKSYKPNMICMEPSEYNKIIEEISKRDSSIAQYKFIK
jgi:hypothetical protein